MDSRLKLLLNGNPAEVLLLLVRLKDMGTTPPYCQVIARFGDVVTCRVQRRYLLEVYNSPDVFSVKAPRLIPAATEEAPAINRSSKPSRRLDLPYSGAGVYFAAVDWGFDFAHANLRHPDGTTRFACIWDQNGTYDGNRYGYGRIYTAKEINNALTTDTPYQTLGYHPGTNDLTGAGMHGTHVMDIATGTPAVGEGGLATGTTYIAVQLGANFVNGSDLALGDSVRLVEALDFIRTVASDGPCVINMSLGSHGDSHTGRSLVELAMDHFLEHTPGFAIVQSVGNYFSAHCHLQHTMQQGETFNIDWNIPRAPFPNEVEIWYEGSDAFSLQLVAPDGEIAASAEPFRDIQVAKDGHAIGYVFHRRLEPNTGLNHIDIILDANSARGRWTIRLFGKSVTKGGFHAYCERNDIGQARFSPRQSSGLTTTGSVCNGRHTITVGAYDHNDPRTPVVRFSSSGPAVGGQAKPDLLAPGYRISAARSAPASARGPIDELTVKSGSSMAAPHVSGTIALLFQKNLPARLGIGETKRLLLDALDPLPASFSDTDLLRSGRGFLNPARLLAPLNHKHMNEDLYPYTPVGIGQTITRRRPVNGSLTMSIEQASAAEATPIAPTDTRIDVRAKFALQHLQAQGGTAAADAEGLIAAINTETLSGIHGDNTLIAVKVARRLGTQRWLLVPPGKDAEVIRVDGFPPGIIFRDGIETTPGRLEAALRAAWAAFVAGGAPVPSPSSLPTLRLGNRGPYVSYLQQSLNDYRDRRISYSLAEPLFNPLQVDGIFGSITQNAVLSFQQLEGLVRDGIVGLQSWTRLLQLKTTCAPTATTVTWSPILADEVALKGTTFEFGSLSIYVPPLAAKDINVNKIVVFFTANSVQGGNTANDFITHGLRGAADATDWIVIGLDSPGDKPTTPDFTVITTKIIKDTLRSICRSDTITCIRLAAHSRGHRGLTRTLMGNDDANLTMPLEKAPINTPFIDVSLVDKIVNYDAFFESAKRVLNKLKFDPAKVTVFHVTDGIGAYHNQSRFIDLAPQSFKVAGIGCIRFIQSAAVTNPAMPAELLKNPTVANELTLLTQARGTFSSLATLPNGMQDFNAFLKTVKAIRTAELLNFFNKKDVVRFAPFVFDTRLAAHHLFVAEFVHELFE